MNAKEEFLDLVALTNDEVKCAKIECGSPFGEYERNIILKYNYNHDGYIGFLKALDFEYDSGYGSQELYGTVWFEDGTWAERGEYDGSEWWEHRKLPEIPSELL